MMTATPSPAAVRDGAATTDLLPERVRSALALCRSRVAIVSAFDGGQPTGCAVSAFLTLSLRPPSLVVSLANGSRTLDSVRAHGRFGFSLLTADQEYLVDVFSRGPREERFRTTGVSVVDRVPLVPVASIRVTCSVFSEVAMYDHTLVVGTILSVPSEPETAAEPGGQRPVAAVSR
jgi:flavin reductase (DIM6/NTAB) family NADH-FMN oxidoreductase RutF